MNLPVRNLFRSAACASWSGSLVSAAASSALPDLKKKDLYYIYNCPHK